MAQRISVANRAVPREQQFPKPAPHLKTVTPSPDYFIERDGQVFAGMHLLLDFWGCDNLDQLETVEQAFRDAIDAAGATLLNLHLHHFESSGGLSGVAILAESHISIHTWPERGYAALDIFMCGGCDPHNAVAVLREALRPETVRLHEQRRGVAT